MATIATGIYSLVWEINAWWHVSKSHVNAT
jgi:hypothetical protein